MLLPEPVEQQRDRVHLLLSFCALVQLQWHRKHEPAAWGQNKLPADPAKQGQSSSGTHHAETSAFSGTNAWRREESPCQLLMQNQANPEDWLDKTLCKAQSLSRIAQSTSWDENGLGGSLPGLVESHLLLMRKASHEPHVPAESAGPWDGPILCHLALAPVLPGCI